MFRCRFLAIVDVPIRTMYRYHAKNASPVKWCLNEKVELLCKGGHASPVVFERKGFAREMVSNCNVGATTYTVCWVGTDRGAAPAEGR